MPEMRIVWVFVPFLAGIFIVNAFFLPLLLKIITAALILAVGGIIFFYAASLAYSNRDVKAERSELRSIISTLEDAVVVYDEDFRMLFFNAAAEKLFAMKSDDVLDKQITPGDAANPALKLLVQVIFPSLAPVVISRSETGTYPQIADVSFDEPRLELRISTNLIQGAEGGTLAHIKIVRDRTRDVAMLKSKSEFVTIASHQLRGPLTNINWALDTLRKDKNLDEQNQNLVKNAFEAGALLLNIVEDLLSVSKIEEGRFGYAFKRLNLAAFLERILEKLLPYAQKLGLKLYLDRPGEEIPDVIADEEKLRMVVENLLDNAMRYNVEKGEIIVKVEKAAQRPFVRVGIRDTGIGIPAEDHDKIFTKFFRAKNALRFKTEGSGLGLYISKNIIRSHGGEMWVESEINRGSAFYFTLAIDPGFVPKKEIPLEY